MAVWMVTRMRANVVGKRLWVIPEGYLPPSSHGPSPQLTSHEAICVLNIGEQDAQLEITTYFEDREPVGPYRFSVPARRTKHLRINDFESPTPVPVDTNFSTVVWSNRPIVVQYTRLDSRQADNALLTTIAYPAE